MESNASLWSSTTASQPTFSRLTADTEVDVAIVGGGITGITAAMLLAATGKRVCLVEARRIGSGVSNRSTVHLTEAVDTRYQAIESDFGKDGAKLVDCVEDILDELRLRETQPTLPLDLPGLGSTPRIPVPPLEGTEAAVYAQLSAEPLPMDDLILETGLAAQAVSGALLMLEMKGVVRRLPGNAYVRI